MHLYVGERVEIGFGQTVPLFSVAVRTPMVGLPGQGAPQPPVKEPVENTAVVQVAGKARGRVRVPIGRSLIGPRWIVISLVFTGGAAYHPVPALVLAR
jgi:hypothetical protein